MAPWDSVRACRGLVAFAAPRCQQKGITGIPSTCPHGAVCPQQCHCQQNLPRALAALRGLHPLGTAWAVGGCSGLCGPRPWRLMIFVGPFHCRALPDFDSRAVPVWLLVSWSWLTASTPAPMAQAGCGGRRGVSWGQSWVQAGHRGPGAGLGWEGRRQGWVGRDPAREMMYGQMYQIAQDKQAVNFIRAHHGFNLAA